MSWSLIRGLVLVSVATTALTLHAQPAPAAPAPKPPAAAPEADFEIEVEAAPATPAPASSVASAPAPVATPAAPAAAGPANPNVPVTAAAVSAPAASTAAAPAAASESPAPAAAGPEASERASLEQRIAALEAALREREAASATDPAKISPAAPTAAPQPDAEGVELLGVRLSAYVQAQYETSQLSEDQLQQGGAPLNRDRFLLRRARLRAQRDFRYAGLDVELDANTVDGVDVSLRRAAGSVFLPASAERVPTLRAQLGLLDIPFGSELPLGARQRVFAERSRASQAFFPAEADVGATLDGGVGPLRYALAIQNGQEAERRYGIRDANSAKDLLVRVGVDLAPAEWLSIVSGVSFIEGTGFHPGSDATKNDLQWNDINEDGSKSDAEVFGVPGSAATPSKNFDRWGVNLDASVGVRTALGWSRLYGELTFAQNLDRGLFVADPVASSLDARELGYFVAFVQEITPYALLGFRLDFYDGNSDLTERRRGSAFERDQSLRTYSPIVGLVLPGRARLVLQYDVIRDKLSRDSRGEPADLANNQWTLRLQVGL